MCLIVLAWQVIPDTPLLAAGNRDEFYDRPTLPAQAWADHPDITAGRDLKAGGTWMGIHNNGRFAALTNFRSPADMRDNTRSRGELVSHFLCGQLSPAEYIAYISASADQYNGFNLLVGNRDTLIWYSNRAGDDARNGRPLPPGIYGLSNALLDTPWPKVRRAKAEFCSLLCQRAPDEALLDLLSDMTQASDCRLPDTGIGLEKERMLSPICIVSDDYGTRTSTLVRLPREGAPVLTEIVLDPAVLRKETPYTDQVSGEHCHCKKTT